MLDIVGDGWTPLVLREAYYGKQRFEAFQTALGISRNILARRLNRLVEEGFLERSLYQDNPPRSEYHLTDKGRDFFGVVAALMRWGDDWLADERGTPVELYDKDTCQRVLPLVVDEATGRPLDVRRVVARRGSGFRDEGEEI